MASGVKVSKMNFELNPRGNLWFNDESTFGHKLLSKMGWSKGKGLGKNEDGIKENIKISKKDTNVGVGWKKDEIPVAVGCLEYENILQKLQKHFKNNQEKPSTAERFEKSLEQRSRTARNHLHYQKFVRGKDLIRYSEKDMKSIFLEKPQKPVSKHPSHPNETPTFDSQLSMKDYFALKMQRKKEEASKSVSNAPAHSQPSDENVSKKRKFVSESPEIETSKKAKLRKNVDVETFCSSVNDHMEKSSESEETLKEAKLRKNVDVETLCSSVNDHMEKSSESEETLKKGKLRKNVDVETLCSSVNDHMEKSSESEETSKRRKKKKKSKKNKLRLQQLKSCLKSQTNYDLDKLRSVSFNEQVSYKILDTSLELCEEINDLGNDEPTINETAYVDKELPNVSDSEEESEMEVSNACGNDDMVVNEEESFTMEGDSCTHEEESVTNEQEPPQCFDLPKSSGSHFNFWLESQRQAAKMKLYKEMIKKIKKNKILRSTNLLHIKGYGNWGV